MLFCLNLRAATTYMYQIAEFYNIRIFIQQLVLSKRIFKPDLVAHGYSHSKL